MREVRDEMLNFWLENNWNVLFIGHYGCGKTTRILDCFKRANLKYKYFSAATMDPWCDFVGVPKVVEENGIRYLDYILPRDFHDDSVEAIYIDEFNRSHKKVRNALMELVQLKSINGRKFNKLRVVWAAINPEEDGDYQVEPLDKSQKDRFQIHTEVPYEPSVEFYTEKFNARLARTIVNWWNALDAKQKMEVSPRRLEYALQVYNAKGNLKDVIPHDCNPSKLHTMLNVGPADDRMKDCYKAKDSDAAIKFLKVENNYVQASKFIIEEIPSGVDKTEWLMFFLQALSSEKLNLLISANDDVYNFVVTNTDTVPTFKRAIVDLLNAGTDRALVRKIKRDFNQNQLLAAKSGQQNTNTKVAAPHYNKNTAVGSWQLYLQGLNNYPLDTTPQRIAAYDAVLKNIPQSLNLNEAVDTLEFLDKIIMRCHSSKLKLHFRNLVNTVNHCIDQIHKGTGFSWNEILLNYGSKLAHLHDKIKRAGMEDKMLFPDKNKLQEPILYAGGGNC